MPCNPPLRFWPLGPLVVALGALPGGAFGQPLGVGVTHPAGVESRGGLALGSRAWFAAGTFGMGADPAQMELGRSLCMTDVRRTAEGLRTVTIDPGVTLRMRVYALRCGAEVVDGPACDPGLFAGEAMAHTVWLPGYGLDRHECTVAAYDRCVAAGVCRGSAWPPGTPGVNDLPTLPVVGVSWDEAQAYCAWVGGRLPTEAEWERAARGIEGRAFAWGWMWDGRRANGGRLGPSCDDPGDGFAGAAPVGSFPGGVTPETVFDLSGNVAEWVSDHAGPWVAGLGYEPAHQVSPEGPADGPERVIRGGAWDLPRYALRTTWRGRRSPGAREAGVGFRCAYDGPR